MILICSIIILVVACFVLIWKLNKTKKKILNLNRELEALKTQKKELKTRLMQNEIENKNKIHLLYMDLTEKKNENNKS